MLKRLLVGIIVTVFCTSVGKGIVAIFGLDRLTAEMIGAAASSELVGGVGWIISGLFGLLGLAGWLAFRLDERFQNLLASRPKLDSLRYQIAVVKLEHQLSTGATALEIYVDVHNENDFLIGFNGTVAASANNMKGDAVPIKGYVAAHQTYRFWYRFPPAQLGGPIVRLCGDLTYDVVYFSAPSGKKARHTMLELAFEQTAHLSGVTGQSSATPITVQFRKHVEE